ncbi:MAG: YkgJ family cysteine cluster protein [Pseudomonadota bacterium]
MNLTTDGLPLGGPFHDLEGDSFQFACHPKVPCFNQCCRDLSLTLTPYDILRLKKKLGLSSGEFLEAHTETRTEPGDRFPKVLLKMSDAPGRPCPFVTPAGCSIYDERPGACRTYPLGRGSAQGGKEFFFLVREDHCQGFKEEKNWGTKEWLADQGLEKYNRFNDLWMEIITSKSSLGPPEHHLKKIQMFFMVSYNLDRFKDFVLTSKFLRMFEVDEGLAGKLGDDDEAVLQLGFLWLKFSLFGEKSLAVKTGAK